MTIYYFKTTDGRTVKCRGEHEYRSFLQRYGEQQRTNAKLFKDPVLASRALADYAHCKRALQKIDTVKRIENAVFGSTYRTTKGGDLYVKH